MPTPSKAALNRLNSVPKHVPNLQVDLLNFQESAASGAKVITDEYVLLTQEKAAWYIDLEVFPGERNVINEHAQFLLDEMQKGNFNADLVILASCEFEGKTYKINGQHTCWAKFFLENYRPKVREIKYRATTFDQLKKLYSQFDRNKSRSDSHITRVHLSGEEGFEDIRKDIQTRATQGLKFLLFDDYKEYRRVSAEDLANLVRGNYREVFVKVCHFVQEFSITQGKIVKRAPALAAMLATFGKDEKVAREFWTKTITGEMLPQKDARFHLHNYLLTTALNIRGGVKLEINSMANQEDMFRICINAWNRWRSGEDTSLLKTTKERQKIR